MARRKGRGLVAPVCRVDQLRRHVEQPGFETLAEGACEDHVEAGTGYRTSLLGRMRVTVPGIRPATVSDESMPLLDTLRRFRHVVRHAYSAEIHGRQLRIVMEDARALRPLLWRDVEALLTELEPTDP